MLERMENVAVESLLVTEPLLGEGGWEMAPLQYPCSCQLRVQGNRLLQEGRGRRVGISLAPSPAQAWVQFSEDFEV